MIIEGPARAMDRQHLLSIGTGLQKMRAFHDAIDRVHSDEIAVRTLITVAQWVRYGAQSIELPATYAAALMATDPGELPEDMRLPWPAFEIVLPPGLLTSSHGGVFSVMITEVPESNIVQLTGRIENAKYFTLYADPHSTSTDTFDTLQHLAKGVELLGHTQLVTEELKEKFDPELERRLWVMLARLIANTIVIVNQARADKPKIYPQLPLRMKHNKARANTHKVGQPLQIDTRQWVREYVRGDRRNSPSLASWVRGHWREQAHGPKHSLHRRIWIHPFRRGEGPLVQRPIKIKEPTT